MRCVRLGLALIASVLLCAPIPVRYPATDDREAFTLKDETGKQIASGEHIESVNGERVESELVFHFNDGSIDDERVIFTQNQVFRLVSDEHVQKGAAFPQPLHLTIDAVNGRVSWGEWVDGKEKARSVRMKLPDDLANGMIALMVLNYSGTRDMKTSFLALADGLRVVRLLLKPDHEENGPNERNERFRLHVEIGGFSGLAASVIGKQPPDFLLWVKRSRPPQFIKMVGPLYAGGPIWTMERRY